MTEGQQDMGKVLAYEARILGRKLERKAERLKAAAERTVESHDVIPTDPDAVRGDMVSLILNGKPKNVTEDAWLAELEARGGCKVATYRRWLNGEVKTPQTRSCYETLRIMGLAYYIGTAR